MWRQQGLHTLRNPAHCLRMMPSTVRGVPLSQMRTNEAKGWQMIARLAHPAGPEKQMHAANDTACRLAACSAPRPQLRPWYHPAACSAPAPGSALHPNKTPWFRGYNDSPCCMQRPSAPMRRIPPSTSCRISAGSSCSTDTSQAWATPPSLT